MARTNKTAVLGSGYNYILEYTGTLPAVAELIAQCTAANRFGTTYNGATLTYTAEVYEESDDMGEVRATVLTSEDVKLKLGAFSWDLAMLEKLASTLKVTTDGNYKVAKLGGIGNDDRKNYVVIFEHVDKKNGNLYVILVGRNTAGLNMAWAKDSVTKLEPEFSGVPMDENGTLVMIVEAPPAAAEQE